MSNSLLQGFPPDTLVGSHRNLEEARSGRGEGSALSTCPPPPSMLGCCGFSGGFSWFCGTGKAGHDAGGLLPRLARFLVGAFWLGSEHDASISVAVKGCCEVISPSMGSEIGFDVATRFLLGPLSSEGIDDPVRWPLVWS